MSPDERDQIVMRFLAAWPRPPMADSQLVVWNEHIGKMAYVPARAALAYLEINSKHRPALSDFHEAYAAQRHQGDDRALAPPECGICDDGFVSVRCIMCECGTEFTRQDQRCPTGYDTSSRCPSGCMPMTPAQRSARDASADTRWKREHPSGQDSLLDTRLVDIQDRTESRNEPEVF